LAEWNVLGIDPQAAANFTANLLQLLGLYRQERRARKDLDHRDFIEWLEYHRHEEIKELITHTYHLESQVDDLLRQDHAEISAKLDKVNEIVVDILAKIEGFAAITSSIAPSDGLSVDAVAILQWFVSSGEQSMMTDARGNLHVGKQILPSTNRRFLSDDIASLISHGFISGETTNVPEAASHYTIYRLTRRGSKFLELLSPDSKLPNRD
jgi:hypothetical protein